MVYLFVVVASPSRSLSVNSIAMLAKGTIDAVTMVTAVVVGGRGSMKSAEPLGYDDDTRSSEKVVFVGCCHAKPD